MDHRPFPKIPTILEDGGGGGSWVATEKIHGAQLVVATNGALVRVGKRKAWLEDDDAFFGWQMLRAELSRKVGQLQEALGRGGELHLYGELHGGAYPHPEVDALPGLHAVQTGIWYSPSLHWSPFDALWVGEDAPVFLAHGHLERLCADVELDTPPKLGAGTRGELSRLPVRYPSRVAERLGHPPIAGNIAEGFVLKPDAELSAAARPVVKHKIPEFDDNRFDRSRPFDANAHLTIDELLRLSEAMMNPMRVASARSKVGEQPAAVAEEMVLDVWIDLEAMFPRRLGTLPEPEADDLRSGLTTLAQAALGPPA